MARIIVIDDDPGMRAMLEQMLWSAGYDVFTADEGRIGLAFSRAAPIHLLITDLYMPGMEGTETIRRFSREFPGVPIIAMSGDANLSRILEEAMLTGIVRTLSKPFRPAELLGLVKTMLPESSPVTKEP